MSFNQRRKPSPEEIELRKKIEAVVGSNTSGWEFTTKSGSTRCHGASPTSDVKMIVQFRTENMLNVKTAQALSDALGTDEINFHFGTEGEPGYSEVTPSSPGEPGYVEIWIRK